jgi:hypothetical protein
MRWYLRCRQAAPRADSAARAHRERPFSIRLVADRPTGISGHHGSCRLHDPGRIGHSTRYDGKVRPVGKLDLLMRLQ